jgi:hypothetical protein
MTLDLEEYELRVTGALEPIPRETDLPDRKSLPGGLNGIPS